MNFSGCYIHSNISGDLSLACIKSAKLKLDISSSLISLFGSLMEEIKLKVSLASYFDSSLNVNFY